MKKDFLTTAELADLLDISQVAVFKKIKKDQIKAQKIGRNFAIPKSEVEILLGEKLSQQTKDEIDRAVKKVVKEYGETLKLLAQE